MNRNKLPLDPCYLGVPSGVLKMISKPIVRSTQTVYLLCRDKYYLQTDRNKLPLGILYLGVLSGVPKVISIPMVHSAQTVHLSCVEIKTISNRIEMSSCLITSPRSTIRCVQNDSKPMVRSAQIMHLSCVEINTISK
jgi:hypothetical protein